MKIIKLCTLFLTMAGCQRRFESEIKSSPVSIVENQVKFVAADSIIHSVMVA